MDLSTIDGLAAAQTPALTDSMDVMQTVTQPDGVTTRRERRSLGFTALINWLFGKTQTTTAQLTLPAATTAKAPLNILAGTAPTAPVDGDIWIEGTSIKLRMSGATRTIASS